MKFGQNQSCADELATRTEVSFRDVDGGRVALILPALSAIRAPVSTRARTLFRFLPVLLLVEVFVGARGDVGREIVVVRRRDEFAERVSRRCPR